MNGDEETVDQETSGSVGVGGSLGKATGVMIIFPPLRDDDPHRPPYEVPRVGHVLPGRQRTPRAPTARSEWAVPTGGQRPMCGRLPYKRRATAACDEAAKPRASPNKYAQEVK